MREKQDKITAAPGLRVTRIVPALGAAIDGVDLARVSDAQFAAMHSAVADYQARRLMYRITLKGDQPA